MNSRRDENGEARLDALLDGVVSENERAEKHLSESPEWQEASRVQGAVDEALRRRLPLAGPPSAEWLHSLAAQSPATARATVDARRGWAMVLAASLVAIVAGAWWWNSGGRKPYFEPQP